MSLYMIKLSFLFSFFLGCGVFEYEDDDGCHNITNCNERVFVESENFRCGEGCVAMLGKCADVCPDSLLYIVSSHGQCQEITVVSVEKSDGDGSYMLIIIIFVVTTCLLMGIIIFLLILLFFAKKRIKEFLTDVKKKDTISKNRKNDTNNTNDKSNDAVNLSGIPSRYKHEVKSGSVPFFPVSKEKIEIQHNQNKSADGENLRVKMNENTHSFTKPPNLRSKENFNIKNKNEKKVVIMNTVEEKSKFPSEMNEKNKEERRSKKHFKSNRKSMDINEDGLKDLRSDENLKNAGHLRKSRKKSVEINEVSPNLTPTDENKDKFLKKNKK